MNDYNEKDELIENYENLITKFYYLFNQIDDFNQLDPHYKDGALFAKNLFQNEVDNFVNMYYNDDSRNFERYE